MAKPIELEINGKRYPVSYPAETPLLYVLRDDRLDRQQVRLRGRAMRRLHRFDWRKCRALLPDSVSAAAAKPITTIEGLEKDGRLNPVQQGVSRLRVHSSVLMHFRNDYEQRRPAASESEFPSQAEIVQSLQGQWCAVAVRIRASSMRSAGQPR